MFRDKLFPGAAGRDFSYVFNKDVGLNGANTDLKIVHANDDEPIPVVKFGAENPYLNANCVGYKITAPAAPGRYDVFVDDTKVDNIEIADSSAFVRPVIRLDTWANASVISAALAKFDVILSPGYYPLTESIKLTDFSSLIGYGAVIARLPNGEYGNAVFSGGSYFRLEGMTIYPYEHVLHSDVLLLGPVIRNLNIVGGALGYGYGEGYFDNVTYDGASTPGLVQGLHNNCSWLRNASGNACGIGNIANARRMLWLRNTFDGTDRGPVFNLNYGDISGGMYFGTRCTNIDRGENGDEIFLVEGSPGTFSNNLFIGTRVRNCDSDIFSLFGGNSRNNRILDTVADGPSGFRLSGWGGGDVSGNVIEQFELRGGRIIFGALDASGKLVSGNVRNNVVRNGALIGLCRSRLNQGNYDPHWYGTDVAMIHAFDASEGESQTITGVSIVDTPAGILRSKNVTITAELT